MSIPGTAWILCVVSDSGQVESLPHQRSWAESLATKHGWTITHAPFEDVSTGREGARKLVQTLIAKLKVTASADRPERLLMIRLDRLGRGEDNTSAFDAFNVIRNLGVTITTREDGDVTVKRAVDIVAPFLRTLVGAMENEVRIDKARAVYDRRRQAKKNDPRVAIGSKAPYGLRFENGFLVPKEPEAAAVRLAFSLKATGYGAHVVAKRLTLQAPPIEMVNGKVQQQKWSSDRTRQMLRRASYRGTLVDDATWHAAQRNARPVSQPTRKNDWPLGGALRCECGVPLHGLTGRGERRYYHCRSSLHVSGRTRSHTAASIEQQFIVLLGDLKAEPGLIERYAAQVREASFDRKDAMRRLTETNKNIATFGERKSKVFGLFETGGFDAAVLRGRLAELAADETTLRGAAETLTRALEVDAALTATIADAGRAVALAQRIWTAPQVAVQDRRAVAASVGAIFGGLIVGLDGMLRVAASVPRASIPAEARASVVQAV